ncbi:MAG TPA: hypothetical protein ENI15_10670 [Spirochaetes bacterium]|nr:hypothetical protein [Spirochaetota bacterium]
MSKLKKIILIVVISIVSVILLFLFVLYNFPYDAVIKRADLYLIDRYSTSLKVQNVRYRYPFKLLLEDVRLTRKDGSFTVHIDNLLLRLRILNFSKSKTAEMSGSGIYFRSRFMDMSDARVNVVAGFDLSQLRKEQNANAVDYFDLKMEGAEVDKVFLTGFEFSEFKIQGADVFLVNRESNFVFERGFLRSDLFTLEISGELNPQSINSRATIKFTNIFFQQYANLKPIVDSIADNGVIEFAIGGSLQKPQVRMIRK